MTKRFLPIGSVVLLKGGSKKIMINGYCAVTESNKDKIYDYRGCPFPEGILISEGTALFDHDQIDEVCFTGYECEKTDKFLDTLQDIVESNA